MKPPTFLNGVFLGAVAGFAVATLVIAWVAWATIEHWKNEQAPPACIGTVAA